MLLAVPGGVLELLGVWGGVALPDEVRVGVELGVGDAVREAVGVPVKVGELVSVPVCVSEAVGVLIPVREFVVVEKGEVEDEMEGVGVPVPEAEWVPVREDESVCAGVGSAESVDDTVGTDVGDAVVEAETLVDREGEGIGDTEAERVTGGVLEALGVKVGVTVLRSAAWPATGLISTWYSPVTPVPAGRSTCVVEGSSLSPCSARRRAVGRPSRLRTRGELVESSVPVSVTTPKGVENSTMGNGSPMGAERVTLSTSIVR